MPIETSPGVRIVEVPSGVRTITGVATAITAFIGRTLRGPVDKPVRVQSFAEYSAIFGGLWRPSTMGYAVSHFFQHGGGDALIVRVYKGDTKLGTATIKLTNMDLEAISPGVWGTALRAEVDHETRDNTDLLLFNLTIEELDRPSSPPPSEFNVVAKEIFRNVSVDPQSPRFVDKVLKEGSALVKVRKSAPATGSPANSNGKVAAAGTPSDGDPITDSEIEGDLKKRSGIHALEEADLFNLLCIPPLTPEDDVANQTWATAARYCKERRAMLIVDPESAWTSDPTTTISKAEKGLKEVRSFISNDKAPNAVAFFPRLRMPDPLSEGRLADFAPCGAVAGIMARTDAQRGVWKAPAGVEASFSGVQGLTYTMTDAQNGVLNPIGLNCLRSFPVSGNLVWGARTMAGDDQLASEWKYLPVRRFALFLEESLFRGTQWVVFEPNDEPLWAQIRLNIGAFMQNLFRQGAFQGRSPREAYIVKCDRETTTQNDINLGIVNILVGFAPLKPAEFVVIRIQQMAGQIDT